MKISFGATYIKPANILKKQSDKYIPHQVSVVELDPKNINDTVLMGILESDWGPSALVDYISSALGDSPKDHVYVLTTQKDTFEKLDDKKVLGVALFKEGTEQNELEAIQTNPKYIARKNKKAQYKNIGSSLVNFLKEKCLNKPLVLYSDDSALGFYEKMDFEEEIEGTNWRIWNK